MNRQKMVQGGVCLPRVQALCDGPHASLAVGGRGEDGVPEGLVEADAPRFRTGVREGRAEDVEVMNRHARADDEDALLAEGGYGPA